MTPTASATTPHPHLLARASTVGAVGLGMLALAGCAAEAPAADLSASYADGSYTASGGYTAPSGPETIDVELTLADDIVTDVVVTPTASDHQAVGFQEKFASGIAAEIVGKDIDSLDVSRVAGSSLTSGGFNAALAEIKAEALEP